MNIDLGPIRSRCGTSYPLTLDLSSSSPLLVFSGPSGVGPAAAFCAAMFLESARQWQQFVLTSLWADEPHIVFHAPEVVRISALIQGLIPRRSGRFAITWIPHDPADDLVPF